MVRQVGEYYEHAGLSTDSTYPGIGFCVAEACVESGASVTISSSKQDRVDAAVKAIAKTYPSAESRVRGYAYSMADAATLESNIASLLDKATSSAKLDHIVWTAGDSLAMMPMAEVDLAKIQQAGMVRFFGPALLGKHAPKYLNAGPASSIVLTTGSAGEKPTAGWTVVSSFASALHGLNRGLAMDLKPLRVNLVSPGPVATELWDGMDEEKKQALFKSIEASTTTGAIGKPQDVAEAFLYLMKDANVTGSMISSNSGHLLV